MRRPPRETPTPSAATVALRAVCLTVVTLVAGAVAHASAGGLLPGVGTLTVVALAVTAVSLRLLATPAGRARVVALTIGLQTFAHLAFTATAGHAGDARAGAPTGRAGGVSTHVHVHVHSSGELHDHAASASGGFGDALAHLVADATGANAPMMLAHLLAAAVVGWWLACGEQALWTVLALALAVVVPMLAPTAPIRPRPRVLPTLDVRPTLRVAVLAPVVVRRGPPFLLAG